MLTIGNEILHDLEYIHEKFGFSEEDMLSIPQNPFKYLRETFKDTAFRASQYKMLHKHPLQWFLYRVLRFYPLISPLGEDT